MGFLTRFFSLRRKEKPTSGATGARGAEEKNNGRQTPVLVIASRFSKGTQQTKFSTSRSTGSMDLIRTQLPEGQEDESENKETKTDKGEAAINRLLRSSSAHFKLISQADYEIAPQASHAFGTMSSRSTSALGSYSTNSGSVGSKAAYSVTVLNRQQHSTTEFPNAYPPVTPLRPGSALAQRSTPNLSRSRGASLDSARPAALVDPRKVPITPRDLGRLTHLRQDPSVVSLVQMYDENGKVNDKAFRNTPMPAKEQSRKRRKSTFQQLLGDDGLSQADLLWAETCLNENASGSAGSSSESTITSGSSSASSLEEQPRELKGRDMTVSSLVVELSEDIQKGDVHDSQDDEVKTVLEMTPGREQNLTMTRGVMRTPSKRASQVFNFIGDRRERRKSMDMLQSDIPGRWAGVNLDDSSSTTSPPPVPPKTSLARQRTTSALSSSSSGSFDGPANKTAIIRSASALGYFSKRHTGPLVVAPPSPEVFRPLPPAPRPRNRSIGAVNALRTAGSTLSKAVSQRSSRTSAEINVSGRPGSDEMRASKERKKRASVQDGWRGPTTSTPRAPRAAKASRRKPGPEGPRNQKSTILMENTNHNVPKPLPRPPTANARTRRKKSFSNIEKGETVPVAMVDASFERRYNTFAASLEQDAMIDMIEKENRRMSGRKRGSLADLGLVRTTSAASAHLLSRAQNIIPHTPSRSHSVRQY